MSSLETENERLREEVAYWKHEAGLTSEASRRKRLQLAFNLTPAEAWICDTLYGATERTIRPEILVENNPFGARSGEHQRSSLSVLICRIRAKLGDAAIETIRGAGYTLSHAARETLGASLQIDNNQPRALLARNL